MKDRMKVHYKIRGSNVTIFESMPHLLYKNKWVDISVGQMRFDSKSNDWTLYYQDSSDRWHIYDEIEPSKNLQDLLDEIDEDPTGIFWG
jgi:hypothetical protein